MNIIVIKIFLIISLFLVFLPNLGFVGSMGSREVRKSFGPEQVKTRLTKLIYTLWMIVYLLWVFLVILYCFKPESVNWLWKVSLLDKDGVKIFALVVTCLGYYLLMAIGVFHMHKGLEPSITKGEKTPMVTTGIFHYIRNPIYLSIDIGVIATFLIIPNLLSLVIAIGIIAILYAVSIDEEKRLIKIYGVKYEKYRKDVGMFFPKLKRG